MKLQFVSYANGETFLRLNELRGLPVGHTIHFDFDGAEFVVIDRAAFEDIITQAGLLMVKNHTEDCEHERNHATCPLCWPNKFIKPEHL